MPAGVVKTKADEKKWDKAKTLAEDAGEAENYAYIMGIYKRMNPDYFKGKTAAIAIAMVYMHTRGLA